MQLWDFITQEELDELPEDSEAAFVEFVHISQRRLREYTNNNPCNNQSEWEELNEARHSFVNIVIGAGKKYGIEPFATMNVPVIANFDDNSHKQFRADIDHYVTQLVVGQSIRGKRDSVHLPQATKDKLRTYLTALREAVEKADLGDGKREALLKKLAAFEAELEKRRLTLLEVTRLMIYVAAVPGGTWASVDVAMKLVNNIVQAVGEAKLAEEEARQLAAPAPMKALSPPRAPAPPPKTTVREDFSADLDDEIPF